jgi:xylulokinase
MNLGIDAGTTSLKVALFHPNGTMQAVSRQEYSLETPQENWVELDPEIYWQACCRGIREVMARTGIRPDQIDALSISSQAETLICLGRDGNPIRKAIVWLDNRAVEEAAEIASAFSIDEVYSTTGQPEITPTWPACKLLWLRHHEPDTFTRSAHFVLVEDYLLYRLTGRLYCEFSLWASSLLVDIGRRCWWDRMLAAVGVEPGRLPEPVEPGSPIGVVWPAAVEESGLSTHTRVVAGAIDQAMGALGAGNLQPGMITETTGGALAVVVTTPKVTLDPGRHIPCHYHALPGLYCLLPWGQTAGMALRWFRDSIDLDGKPDSTSGNDHYDEMTARAAAVPAGSDGLIFLPHLEGAACPEFNPAARGVFFGLSLRHNRAHMIRAVLESVAFLLKKNLDIVEALGVPVDEVRSMGGGARSDLWLQIKADVLQKPVRRVQAEETACLGAAILASTAIGEYRDVYEAVSHMVRPGSIFIPNSENSPVYQAAYRCYLRLYEQLEPLFQL